MKKSMAVIIAAKITFRSRTFSTPTSCFRQLLWRNGFILNCSVSGAPKSVAGTQYLMSVFRQTLAWRELSLKGDLSPSADRRSSFARWRGATRGRQDQVDHKASTIPRGSILETGRHLPSIPNPTFAPQRLPLLWADGASGTAPAVAGRKS